MGNPVYRKFLQNVLVCTSSDSRTTWRNYATNWSTPTLPSLLPPWLPSACSRIALERRQLYRWPWSSWRDHTSGLAVSSTVLACCSRITFGFGTWAHQLLTLLHCKYNSVSAKECYLWRCEWFLGLLLMKQRISAGSPLLVAKISNTYR